MGGRFLTRQVPLHSYRGPHLNEEVSERWDSSGNKIGSTIIRCQGAPRAKFVDAPTVLEVVPRNCPSLLNFIVDEIESCEVTNNMRLNPVKCKECSVDFLRYESWNWKPIVVGGAFIERVSCFNLLGVHISDDPTWAAHCDAIIKKANRRLYALTGAPNVNFRKISVRKTIWDLEFSEHLL